MCRNIQYLYEVSRLDVMKEPKYRLKAMPYQNVEEIEPWRLLTKLLDIRLDRSY